MIPTSISDFLNLTVSRSVAMPSRCLNAFSCSCNMPCNASSFSFHSFNFAWRCSPKAFSFSSRLQWQKIADVVKRMDSRGVLHNEVRPQNLKEINIITEISKSNYVEKANQICPMGNRTCIPIALHIRVRKQKAPQDQNMMATQNC